VFELIFDKLHDTRLLAMVFAAIAAGATVLTLAAPFLSRDTLGARMRAVGAERDRIRQRERERMARSAEKVALRQSPKQFMQKAVEQFDLNKWVGQEAARDKLMQAGYRGQAPYVAYLFFRMVMPLGLLAASALYVFVIIELDQPTFVKLGICLVATYLGIKSPDIFLQNRIARRKQSINRAFPDALDLLLICVESGMSVETAFRKVGEEIGSQSIELAEELALLTAELSYLPDRKQAYENLAKRVELDGVRSVCLALQQAERYGTPMAQTLRVLGQENRDMRMSEAEKRAAALPPKLTVPMILFFLPVLFVVILGPVMIRVIFGVDTTP
jgi:tight adherence protein C